MFLSSNNGSHSFNSTHTLMSDPIPVRHIVNPDVHKSQWLVRGHKYYAVIPSNWIRNNH